jgi:hypothetical protein
VISISAKLDAVKKGDSFRVCDGSKICFSKYVLSIDG